MHYSEEEKAMWLEDWPQSGKSAWAYAKGNGLNPQTFVKWTKPKAERKSCFVEVSKAAIQPEVQAQEILIESGKVKIHIPVSLGSGELREIFSALRDAV